MQIKAICNSISVQSEKLSSKIQMQVWVQREKNSHRLPCAPANSTTNRLYSQLQGLLHVYASYGSVHKSWEVGSI